MRYQQRVAAVRQRTPGEHLRIVGKRSRVFAHFFVFLFGVSALSLVLSAAPHTLTNVVGVILEGAMGLFFLAHSVIALAASPRFPDVGSQKRQLDLVRRVAVSLAVTSSAALLVMALVDDARRPELADAAIVPMVAFLAFWFFHMTLRDALRYGTPGSRVVTPSEYLRHSGKVFGATGSSFVVAAALLRAHYALHGHALAAFEVLFVALLGAFGLVFAMQSAVAFWAAPRFPMVAGLARINGGLALLALAVGVGGLTALVYLGGGGVAELRLRRGRSVGSAASQLMGLETNLARFCRAGAGAGVR